MKKTLWALLVIAMLATVSMAADDARSWVMTPFRGSSEFSHGTVSVVDGGAVCLYIATTWTYGGQSVGVWGIEKYKIGGKCQ